MDTFNCLRMQDATAAYRIRDESVYKIESTSTFNVPTDYPDENLSLSRESSRQAGLPESSSIAFNSPSPYSASIAAEVSSSAAYNATHQPNSTFNVGSVGVAGDYLKVNDGTITAHPNGAITTAPAHDTSYYANMAWHNPGHIGGQIHGSYGSYNSQSSSQVAVNYSPLSDLYSLPQPAWQSPSLTEASKHTQLSNYATETLFHGAEIGQNKHPPQTKTMGGAYFPPDLELTSWPVVSGPDQSANLQLPPPEVAFGTAQIAASTASTPQFFDTGYSDSEMDVISNLHRTGSAGGNLLMPAVGPEQQLPCGQRDSIRGKDKASAGESTSNEGSRAKLQHSGRGKSGSAEGAGNTGSKKDFMCNYQFCKSPAFTRMADLERHMKHVHLAADKKERFFCDYSGCSRNSTPFHRKDHYREHLREYHLEDLLKRGSNAHRSMSPNTEAGSLSGAVDHETNKKLMQEMQLQNCNIDASWWRCARCLKRVKVADRGWSCPDCKGSIEEPRKSLRASRLARDNAIVPPNVDSSINLSTIPTWPYEQLPLKPYE